MVLLLILMAIFVGLISVGAWRTAATFVFGIYATILLVLGFIVGGLFSWVVFPASVSKWHLSQSWVTQIVDSPDSSIMQLFSIPFVFVADVYRWMFEITLFQGTPFLWITMLIAVWKVAKDARVAYTNFQRGRQEMIDLRMSAKGNSFRDSSMPDVAETTLDPGYDAAGNFVGFKTNSQAMKHGYY